MIYYEIIKYVDFCFGLRYFIGEKIPKGVVIMNTMKKMLGVILLCCVLCSGGCGKTQSEAETTQPEAETTQSETVAATEQSTQKPDESLARTVEVDYGEGTAVFEFNEKGLLVSEKNKPWGAADIYYSYDNESRITEITYASDDEGAYENYEKVTYEYGSDGKLSKTNTYSLPENVLTDYCEYTYENGRLVKKDYYDRIQGELVFTYSDEFHYNETEEGSEIVFRCVSSDGSVGESKSTYDKSGRLIREDYPGGAGTTVYVYDENGNLIKEIYGENEQEKVYEYENNILVKSVWTKDDFLAEEHSNKGNYNEYKHYDNGNIVAVYWYDKTGALEEINIHAVPEVKGNYAEITEF